MPNQSRQWIELTILANSILLPGDGVKAVELLEPTHFATPLHRKIFTVIQASHSQGKIMPEDFMIAILREDLSITASELCDLLSLSVFPANTLRLCLSLIELNVREAFVKLLHAKAKSAVLAQQHEQGYMYQSCSKHLADLRKDIFESVPLIRQYLEQYVPDELEEYRELEAKIPKMIKRVKSQDKAKRLVDTIEKLCNHDTFTPERKQVATLLKDLLLMTLGNFALPPDLYKKLIHLNQTLWEPLPSDPLTNF